jgi:CheY-like chemotaxis protein
MTTMTSSQDDTGLTRDQMAKLRHDLLNPLNVLAGATNALLQTDLTAAQRGWVQMMGSTTNRLLEIAKALEEYRDKPGIEGRARLADLLSIAAARVAKPFSRERLRSEIERIAGRRALRILLVDDSPELVQLVRTFLTDTGWTLDVVETGERAVAQATTEQYDVVLMDIDLPGLDGATAAHAIRAADLARDASPTPIVAMTAFDQASPEPQGAATAQDHDVITIEDPEIAPLIPEFMENRRADVVAFRDALRDGDYNRIQSSAHKMKGSGSGYGFSVVSRIGADLELAAHRQETEKVTALIDELDAYLQKVHVTMP